VGYGAYSAEVGRRWSSSISRSTRNNAASSLAEEPSVTTTTRSFTKAQEKDLT
jgi:hypothetical protein